MFYWILKAPQSQKRVNPFLPNVAFDIETNHLICKAKQMTGFYIKRNTGLKWVKSHHLANRTAFTKVPKTNYSKFNEIIKAS